MAAIKEAARDALGSLSDIGGHALRSEVNRNHEPRHRSAGVADRVRQFAKARLLLCLGQIIQLVYGTPVY